MPKGREKPKTVEKKFDRGITTETRKRTKTKIFGSKTKSEKQKSKKRQKKDLF